MHVVLYCGNVNCFSCVSFRYCICTVIVVVVVVVFLVDNSEDGTTLSLSQCKVNIYDYQFASQ